MTTYHYYPKIGRTQTGSSAPTFDRMTYERSTRSSASPPPLSRASTPDSSSAPSTPVFRPSFLSTSKMSPTKGAQVGFASPLATSSCRIAHWDELSVMRAFAAHAKECSDCRNLEETRQNGQTLCRKGTELVKDIGQYFYCWDSKPYSTIDRKHQNERVQVEIPPEYAIVKTLFEALSKGLRFASLKQKRPEIHHANTVPVQSTPEKESYELKVNRTGSRRQRSNTYAGLEPVPKYETRSPDDPIYHDVSESKSRGSRREHKRGSLYVPEERSSKRKSTYILPFSSGWLN